MSSNKTSEVVKDSFIEDLLQEMTLEEKVGQMTQINLDVISKGEIYQLEEPHSLDITKLRNAILKYHVGSFLNCPGYALPKAHWVKIITQIQDLAINESRLKVPVIYGIDAIHGANYMSEGVLFPQPVAQAASWDPKLAQRVCEITAIETRSMGTPWAFSPVLDVMRQALWVRNFETFGEDPMLVTDMGLGAVKGLEGEDVSKFDRVASCLKHFIGYSWPYDGKDRSPAYIPERQLRELIMPPFEEAIKAGAKTIMVNSGEINGIPTHSNPGLLQKVLRDELGFEGVAVSDWEDIIKLHQYHRTSPNLKHAVKTTIMAGVDMAMVPNNYEFSESLVELVREGEVPESRLDESVRRILKLKKDLGLWENPVVPPGEYVKSSPTEFEDFSRKVAEESITLLKNEGNCLPLKKEQKVLLTGPMSDSLSMVNGAWSRTWQGQDEHRNNPEKNTVLDALKIVNANIDYAPGCTLTELKTDKAWEEKVKASDVVIACLGELPGTEKPGDVHELVMDEAQLKYIEHLSTFGKEIVLILFESRPRIINRIVDLCGGIIHAYFPSEEGTLALADILYGNVNPSGKLPYTYPRYANTLLTYDFKITADLNENYELNGFKPQFEFGHGLSYTSFEYNNFRLDSPSKIELNDDIHFSVEVTNTGNREGKEVVQLYISDVYASVTPPVKRLRAYDKILLMPGETKRVEFVVPCSRLAFVGRDWKWLVEPGDFIATIGNQHLNFYINE